jgi:glycine/D-amino acid oxidase-like deaminating enzyme
VQPQLHPQAKEANMKLLTQEQEQKLLANGRAHAADQLTGEETTDFAPVVKLFCPWGGATWLLTELDPDEPDIAFGLCDLGMGFPELGNVSLAEIQSVSGPGGLRIERDLHFSPTQTLQAYADEARRHGRIVA